MTAAEEGVLLLCCALGDPESRPLTMAEFRELGLRVRASSRSGDGLRDLRQSDLTALGYDGAKAARIVGLLERETRLRAYLRTAERQGIYPVTRVSPAYPSRIAVRQKLSSPPVLFCRGDAGLFAAPSVAVVGSRRLNPPNERFAAQAGRLAAAEGLTLVSGGAAGADRTAQNACLHAGGSAVIFVPDRLVEHPADSQILFCSEDGFDLPFTPVRAMRRNALIHMQGDRTLAAQCTYGSGGTWHGSLENLKHGWSPLFVFEDGTRGSQALIERGGTPVRRLESLQDLRPAQKTMFDPA